MTEPAREMPQLAVACPACGAEPGELCTSHGGTRPRRYDTHQARAKRWRDAQTEELTMTRPTYPAPGSEIPNQPGYVVGRCGHRVAGSEWAAGFRSCERCPSDSQTRDETAR